MLTSEQPRARLNVDPIFPRSHYLYEVKRGIFGLTLSSKHVKIIVYFQYYFREVMAVFDVKEPPKAQMLTAHDPQFIV